MGGYSPNQRRLKNPSQPIRATQRPQDQVKPIVTQLREILSKKISDDLVKMTKTRTEVRVMLDPPNALRTQFDQEIPSEGSYGSLRTWRTRQREGREPVR